jgi:hypothetical protein
MERTATATTVSKNDPQFRKLKSKKLLDSPSCPSKTCTTSLVCRSQSQTLLSSLPLTIHFPPVTLKQAAMQYFVLVWPTYVFRHLAVL